MNPQLKSPLGGLNFSKVEVLGSEGGPELGSLQALFLVIFLFEGQSSGTA